VFLAGIQYDHVDLRFDAIIERDVPIVPEVVGSVADDYQLVRVEVEPERWTVRGGESVVVRLQKLGTEPLDIDDATADVSGRLTVAPPPSGVYLVGEGEGEQAEVVVRAAVQPRPEERSYTVPVAIPDELDPTGAVPRTYEVEVSGPMPDFRTLEAHGIAFPVEAVAEIVEGDPQHGGVVEVRFSWAASVPGDVRARLQLDHGVERVRLPPRPPPPPSLDLPEPGE
jgi:hypothetical protein